MKRGFRALAVLAAVTVMSAGSPAMANCAGELYAVFQCADRAYFNPAPTGSGVVSSAFWQVGFGNGTLNTGVGTAGTGIGGGLFNGNDNGVFTPELIDAQVAIGSSTPPAGSLCFRNNNWANSGIDGCCDNPRGGVMTGTEDDNILNPLYNVYSARNLTDPSTGNLYKPEDVPSNDWVMDGPMMALLRESTGSYFAVAAVSTSPRAGVGDITAGFYSFHEVSNGLTNPITSASNVVPWQLVPGRKACSLCPGLVRDISDANMPGSPHILTLGWDSVIVYSDNASRPSTNPTVPSGGMGTTAAEAGGLVRYVVEKQTNVNASNPGALDPNGWVTDATYTNPTNSAFVTVDPNSCVRLHTYFGASNVPVTQNNANCRVGKCGDLGYDVVSPVSCVTGALASEAPIELKAIRQQGGVFTITWRASAELTTTSYRIDAVTKKGAVTLGTVPATETGTGTSAAYKFTAVATQLKGARTIEVIAMPSGSRQRVQIR
jgi:hypothetical protein